MQNEFGMEAEMSQHSVGDVTYGKVTSRDRRGAYVELDNGEGAFSFNAGNVPIDTKILCVVTRETRGNRRCIVKLESVCGLFDVA